MSGSKIKSKCSKCGNIDEIEINPAQLLGKMTSSKKAESSRKNIQKAKKGSPKRDLLWSLIQERKDNFTISEIHRKCPQISKHTIKQYFYEWRKEGSLIQLEEEGAFKRPEK